MRRISFQIAVLLGAIALATLFNNCGGGFDANPGAVTSASNAASGTLSNAPSIPTSSVISNKSVTVLTDLVVSSNTIPNLPGWSIGGKILSAQATAPPPVSGDAPYALVATYPSSGPTGMGGPWANFSVAALNTESIYIDFWAKMPDAKEGFKFCKIFGQKNSPVGYADATFQTDYTDVAQGGFVMVGFGDGTNTINDGENIISLDDGPNMNIGRATGTATVLTPQMSYFMPSDWGTSWHHFRIHVRFNSGTSSANEISNGEIYFEIDGKVYVKATGLYNRNPQNGPIDYIGLFGWAQNDPQPFDIWYDNVVISTGGFASGPEL